MANDGENRREALKILGAIGATCAFPFSADELYGQHAGHDPARVHEAASTAPRYFREGEWKIVSRLADLIIPDTDTPGAVVAGVPAYIDYVVGQNGQQQSLFRSGVAWLEKQDFLSLSEERQVALLTPLIAAVDSGRVRSDQERFLGAVKMLTADGYFTSKIGLMQALGYKGNAVLAEFPGCSHEH